MPDRMSKTERVLAATRGQAVDRVPVSAWWHDFAREWSAEDLAGRPLEQYRKYDWDFIKVNPRASYFAEDWGAKYAAARGPPAGPHRAGVSLRRTCTASSRWTARGVWRRATRSARLIADGLSGEAPFIQTIFSPLAMMSRITGSTKYVQRLMRENRRRAAGRARRRSRRRSRHTRGRASTPAPRASSSRPSSGARRTSSPCEDYERFCRPFDLRVLDAVQGAPFNVFHVCRANNHLMRAPGLSGRRFPLGRHAEGNPRFAEIAVEDGRPSMGGVSHEATMLPARPTKSLARRAPRSARRAGRRFLLAPGCSIDPTTPEANLRALVEAARS